MDGAAVLALPEMDSLFLLPSFECIHHLAGVEHCLLRAGLLEPDPRGVLLGAFEEVGEEVVFVPL